MNKSFLWTISLSAVLLLGFAKPSWSDVKVGLNMENGSLTEHEELFVHFILQISPKEYMSIFSCSDTWDSHNKKRKQACYPSGPVLVPDVWQLDRVTVSRYNKGVYNGIGPQCTNTTMDTTISKNTQIRVNYDLKTDRCSYKIE